MPSMSRATSSASSSGSRSLTACLRQSSRIVSCWLRSSSPSQLDNASGLPTTFRQTFQTSARFSAGILWPLHSSRNLSISFCFDSAKTKSVCPAMLLFQRKAASPKAFGVIMQHTRWRLSEQLKEAQECIARLQEQLLLENKLLDQFPSHQSDNSDTVTDAIEAYCGMTEMEKEIQTLQRKLFFGEVALKLTQERCQLMENNYNLLRTKEKNLLWRSLACQTKLQHLKSKHEAIQFSRSKEATPAARWLASSLPNLYL